MKKFYAILMTLFMTQYAFAQWPANYGGVMLQAFYWDSFEDTKWTKLTEQADEISTYFDLLWVPNSGNCVSANSMGYMPVYWFDHRSSFGSRERYLTEMISAYNERNVKVIEDVVINHKAPLGKNGSWIDFANEERTSADGNTVYKVEWTGADICANDDGGYTLEQGWPVTGGNDTGDDFSGARDLDHTSPNVQQNCKTYLKFLLDELHYSGFRLDMVKGYGAQYTKMYNEYAQPEFCVGEYWDGSVAALTNWINGTGKTSAAFDFALKYVIRDAFGGGSWGALSNKGLAGSPDYSRYAVTFIDNHDTYENQDRLVNNVLAANGLILAMPGTPCIFLKHWQRYPIGIGNMILARKACGLTNQSPIVEQQELDGGYVIKTQGTKGTVLYICGFPQYDTTGFKLIASGTNFAYFVSDNINVEGLRDGNDDDDTEQRNITVYISSEVAPNLYAWTSGGAQPLGDWPGQQLTETADVTALDGTTTKTFWKYTFSVAPVSIVINNGAGVQTSDITGLAHDSYFTFDDTNSNKETNWTDITSLYYQPEPVQLPACVKPIDGHLYVYFRGNKDYDTPYAWVWNDSKNFCANTEWPGDKMKWVGTDGSKAVWLWDFGTVSDSDGLPTGVLFSNKGSDTLKTSDFTFQNGGYYDVYGLLGNANDVTGIQTISNSAPSATAVIYDLQGRRVDSSYRGLVIQNGRKVLQR
ncbi:MAG: starch-binding protein [Prevotella sp.]|nr:starch-binding protein [Prevotella sp.]